MFSLLTALTHRCYSRILTRCWFKATYASWDQLAPRWESLCCRDMWSPLSLCRLQMCLYQAMLQVPTVGLCWCRLRQHFRLLKWMFLTAKLTGSSSQPLSWVSMIRQTYCSIFLRWWALSRAQRSRVSRCNWRRVCWLRQPRKWWPPRFESRISIRKSRWDSRQLWKP